MTPEAFRSELSRLGLSQLGAARMLKVGPRTVRRWAAGEVDITEAVALLLPKLTRKEAQTLAALSRSPHAQP